MAKLLLGIAVGIASTTTAFVFFASESDEIATEVRTEVPLASSPVRDGDEVIQTGEEISPRDEALAEIEALREALERVESLKAQAQEAIPDLTEEQLRNLTTDELDAMIAASAGGPKYGRMLGESVRRARVEMWSNAPPPTEPITLPPEFGWLETNYDGYHELLQREPVDPNWSYTTEAQIATFLGEHPEITQKYGQPQVTCRTSGCQLAFVAYGVDETFAQITGVGLGPPRMLSAVTDYPWADQFRSPTNTLFNTHTDGNVTTILWHLIKKPEEGGL
jgi:hypothetical protein